MELLTVVVIVGTLAGIGYPVFQSFVAKSREAACLDKMRSLGVALQEYLQENNNIMPELAAGRSFKSDESPVLETVLLGYVANPASFQCPADKKEFAKSGSSYLWNTTQNGLHVSKLSFFGQNRPDKIPLITDKESWHPGDVNFLYADLSSSNKTRFVASN